MSFEILLFISFYFTFIHKKIFRYFQLPFQNIFSLEISSNLSTTNLQKNQTIIKSSLKKEIRKKYNQKIFAFSQLTDPGGKNK